MKKIQMMMLVAIAAFMVMPVVSALEISAYSKVIDYTPNGVGKSTYGDAIEGVGDEGNRVTTFDITGKDLIVIDELKDLTEEHKRPEDDATWFGIAVEKPTTGDSLSSACWVRAGKDACESDSAAVKDAGEYYTLWVPFKSQELKDAIANTGKGAVVSKEIQLRWGGNDDKDDVQTIYINLHTDSVTLTIDPDADPENIAADAKFDEEDEQAAIEEYEENHPNTSVDEVEENEEQAEQAEQKPEPNADTADINLGLLLSVLALSSLGIGYTVKKRFN